MTDKILNWLRTFAPFAGMITEFLGVSPGCCGLFPQGQTRRQARRDVLGRTCYDCSRNYLIRYRAIPGASAVAVTEAFGAWVSGSGNIPGLEKNTRIGVKNAHLAAREQTGTAIYEMTLALTWEECPARGQTTLYQINGKNLLTPDDPVSLTVQTVEDPLSGYDESGALHRYPIKNTRLWQFTYENITEAEKTYLEGLLLPMGEFLFSHPEGTATGCFRVEWETKKQGPDSWSCRFSVKEG